MEDYSEINITVITVVFNAVKYLEDTLINVLSFRSKVKLEYIIIDGGSNDGGVELIVKYSKQLFFWVSEPDKGIYDAFNKGWNQARVNSYIMYLGAGDKIIALPEALDNDVDVYYGKVILGSKGEFNSKFDFRLKLGNTLHHQALLVKKKPSISNPFDLQFKIYSDFDFNQRLLKEKAKFKFDKNLISFALPGGISEKFDSKESLKIVEKNFGLIYKFLAFFYYKVLKLR